MIKMDFVTELPKEISQKVFSFLSAEELSQVALVSRQWRKVANQDKLWWHHCRLNGWLKFGLQQSLLEHGPFSGSQSHHSPVFHLEVPKHSTLLPICKWMQVFLRAHHLHYNWARGRYTLAPIMRGHKEKVTTMDTNGRLLVTGSEDKMLLIWDLEKCTTVKRLTRLHGDTINKVVIKGSTIVTACADGLIRVINAESGRCEWTIQARNGSVDMLAYDGELIVSTAADRCVRVWSVPQEEILYIMSGHLDDIECMSRHGNFALTGSWDTQLMLWDVREGRRVCSLSGHTEVVTCCKFDHQRAVSGSADSTVRIWSIQAAECIQVLYGHEAEVYCIEYNQEVIVSGSSDSSIRIWSHHGKCQHVLTGHLGVVRCLHLDDEKLVSGGDQKKIIIWDYRKGEQLNVVHRNPTRLHMMLVTETKLITASPERPGTVTMLCYW